MKSIVLALVASAALSLGSYAWQAPRRADLALVNGRIYTLDPARPWVEAVAITGSQISAVGSSAEVRALASDATRVIDLRGAFALPGFNDAHVHVDSTGALLIGVNLLDVHEATAFATRVREAVGRLPKGSWITRGEWGAYEQWGAGSAGQGGAGAKADVRSSGARRPHSQQTWNAGSRNSGRAFPYPSAAMAAALDTRSECRAERWSTR